MDKQQIESIVEAVLAQIKTPQAVPDSSAGIAPAQTAEASDSPDIPDIASPQVKAIPLLDSPCDPEALARMMSKTPARIGVGCAGGRLKTQTLLALRADHAAARDSVFLDVDEKLIESLGLFSVRTKCSSKDEYLTRPDLGRLLCDEGVQTVTQRCRKAPDVQIIVSDGLSSKAITANAANILPAISDGLEARGISQGTPFFVKYGRVGVMDHVSELLSAKVTCILVGERPGLGSAESMSAYIAYDAKVAMPEANRTVVSNIYSGGVAAVEAGAYIAELIEKILAAKASGVNLRK